MSVRHGLLALLERGPMHGYQLRAAFEESTGGTWPLNIGQVYTTLSRTVLGALSRRALAGLRRRRVGYVFQDLNLLASLTAAENVALPLELDGVGVRQANGVALAALAEVDLDGYGPRFPDQLSGGQQQRVAIARALVGRRRLVLADEPTGALDSQTGGAVLRLLRAKVDAGAAGVLVTHEARMPPGPTGWCSCAMG
jgi:ABC-type lipoprotein export system ATPase subunit